MKRQRESRTASRKNYCKESQMKKRNDGPRDGRRIKGQARLTSPSGWLSEVGSNDYRHPMLDRKLAVVGVLLSALAIGVSPAGHGPATASPEGRNGDLAFTLHDDQSADQTIHLISPKGGASTELLAGSSPAWSADGSMIAFQSCAPECGLWVADADGTEATRITAGAADTSLWAGAPSWSPSGKKLAFTR